MRVAKQRLRPEALWDTGEGGDVLLPVICGSGFESGAPTGVYHCVNSGRCTWLEFAQELVRQLGIEPRLVPVRMADMTLRAQRPLYCALSNDKLRAAGVMMPTWEQALQRYLQGFGDEIAHEVADRQ